MTEDDKPKKVAVVGTIAHVHPKSGGGLAALLAGLGPEVLRGTVTGRTSATLSNESNLPRRAPWPAMPKSLGDDDTPRRIAMMMRDDYRVRFPALHTMLANMIDPGPPVVVGADYGAVEERILAHYAREKGKSTLGYDYLCAHADPWERALMAEKGFPLPETNPKPSDVYWGLEGEARMAFKSVRMGRLYGQGPIPMKSYMLTKRKRKAKGWRRHVRRMKAAKR